MHGQAKCQLHLLLHPPVDPPILCITSFILLSINPPFCDNKTPLQSTSLQASLFLLLRPIMVIPRIMFWNLKQPLLYHQKHTGKLWNQQLVNKLSSISFQQLSVDKCFFYCNGVILIFYMYDSIFLSPFKLSFRLCWIQHIQECWWYLWVWSCTLIDAIVADVGMKDTYTKPVLAKESLHLHAFKTPPQILTGISTNVQLLESSTT